MRRPHTMRLALTAAAIIGATMPAAAGAAGWTVGTTPNPGVYGNIFKAVTVVGTDVWAVGDSETQSNNATLAARDSGAGWSRVATPNPMANCQDGNIQWAGQALKAVSGTSASDVWAVGQGCLADTTLVEHFDGTRWRLVPAPSPSSGQDGLTGVTALSPADAWSVGYTEAANGASQTLIEHYDGTAWKRVSSPSPSPTSNLLNGVSGASATDVWAVGSRDASAPLPLILHYDGTAWKAVASPALPTGSYLLSVHARTSNDVWAVGWQSSPATGARLTLVEHYDGTSWKVMPSPNLNTAYGSENLLRSVVAISATDAWAVGMFEDDDATLHQHRTFALHWNGTTWAVAPTPSPGKSSELLGVAATPAHRVWAVGIQSPNPIDIYFGVYQPPRTLALAR